MLSRDKQLPVTVGSKRNNTLSLTYDMKNTSTKLILLNFSKKEDNRIRGHESNKEGSSFKSSRTCLCLGESAPACACHHRDKDLSFNARRHNACHNAPINDTKLTSTKEVEKSHHDNKLPPCTITNKESGHGKSKKDTKQQWSNFSARHYRKKTYNRDLEILYSMPSLSHPDFTMGQRRVLLSLARIYTNITPINRFTNDIILREISDRQQSRHSKGTKNKKSKEANKKKSKTASTRRGSLQTAVKTFTSENDKDTDVEDALKDYEEKIKKRSSGSISDTELDAMVEDWVINVIENQAMILASELKDEDECMDDEDNKDDNNELLEAFEDRLTEELKMEYKDDYEEDIHVMEEHQDNDETEEIETRDEQEKEKLLLAYTSISIEEEKEILDEEEEKYEEKVKEGDQRNEEKIIISEDVKETVGNSSIEKAANSSAFIKEDTNIDVDTDKKEEVMESENIKRDNLEEVDGEFEDNGSGNINVLRYISDELRQMMINK